jgi:hypothetical protein
MKSAEEKAREDMHRSQDIVCAHDICVAIKKMEEEEEEYNERTCITAGELRAAGVAVPRSIPDCGWVPKHTMKFGEPTCAVEPDNTGAPAVACSIPIILTVPFRWVSVDLVLGDTPKDCRP